MKCILYLSASIRPVKFFFWEWIAFAYVGQLINIKVRCKSAFFLCLSPHLWTFFACVENECMIFNERRRRRSWPVPPFTE